MRLLLLSNSTNEGEEYLQFALPHIQNFIHYPVHQAVFIPFASVRNEYSEYTRMVNEKLKSIQLTVQSIHVFSNQSEAIQNADLIIVGGGNTFHLLYELQQKKLLSVIEQKVRNGTPYIGWSAGSNLACPSISTTNDMPIIHPHPFKGLHLVPFQINPHYYNQQIQNHKGETRDERIHEFCLLHPHTYVIGLPEGTLLVCIHNKYLLKGCAPAKLFKKSMPTVDIPVGSNLADWLE